MIPERITTIEAVSMAKSIMEKAERQRAEFAQRVADSERAGCDCCDTTSDSPDPVVVRLERENEELLEKIEQLEQRLAAAEAALNKPRMALYAEILRLQEQLAAAQARNECPECGMTPGAVSTCSCEECVGELKEQLADAEAFVAKFKCGTCGGVRVKEAELCTCDDEAAKAAGGDM